MRTQGESYDSRRIRFESSHIPVTRHSETQLLVLAAGLKAHSTWSSHKFHTCLHLPKDPDQTLNTET